MFGEASRAARPRRKRWSAGSVAWPADPFTLRRLFRSALGAEPARAPPFRDEPARPRPDVPDPRALRPFDPLRPPASGAPAQTGPADRPCSGRPARCRPGDVDRRPALQADRGLALAGDRAVVRVVQAAERLVVRREVALRVIRAPPEDVSGPPRATRDERARRHSSGTRPRTGAGRAAADPRA